MPVALDTEKNVFNPYGVAGLVSTTGVITCQSGRYDATCTIVGTLAYTITFPAHPSGANYVVMLVSQGTSDRVYVRTGQTSTQVLISCTSVLAPIYFMVLAPMGRTA